MRQFKDWRPPVFDEDGWAYSHDSKIRYGWRCQCFENMRMKPDVDIGCFTYLNAKYGIELGLGVQIGANCSVYSESTIDNKKGKVVIGDYACIGAGCVIMPGVRIGNDAVVAACSFVNKDVEAGDIVGGAPAVDLDLQRWKYGGRFTKTVRCLKCEKVMKILKEEIQRGGPVYFFVCENCGCHVSLRESK